MSSPFEARNLIRFLVLSCAAALCGPVAAHADTIYAIDVTITSNFPTGNPNQSDRVKGFITTDGTIGYLKTSNILDWDLQLIDNLKPANNVELTPSNSAIVLNSGTGLKADETGLAFDYSRGGAIFGIQGTPPEFYGYGSGYSYFCFSAYTDIYRCYAGETISPNYIYTDGVVTMGANVPVGLVPLGPAPDPSPVPEPSTLGLMITGGLSLCAYLKRRFAA